MLFELLLVLVCRAIVVVSGSYYWFLGHCFVFMLFGFYLAHTAILKFTEDYDLFKEIGSVIQKLALFLA